MSTLSTRIALSSLYYWHLLPSFYILTTTKRFATLLQQEINWYDLALAIFALTPLFILYLITNKLIFLNMGLITISLYIASSRLNFSIPVIIGHYLIILICFSLLYFSLIIPPLFVLTCSFLALGTIYLTKYGDKLRTLSNYTFIPAVYLSCEIYSSLTQHNNVINQYLEFITLSLISLGSVIFLQVITSLLSQKNLPKAKNAGLLFWHKLLTDVERGEPTPDWIKPAFAIFIGVLIAASLVTLFHIPRGEWVIWSTASVITTDFASAKKKLRTRLLGAVIGISMGLVIGIFLPKTAFIYSMAVLGVMLTLLAFKKYFLSFSSRCLCITLAASAISSSTLVAIERIDNVFLGGVIGVLSSFFAYRMIK